jgi:hypothetical protein
MKRFDCILCSFFLIFACSTASASEAWVDSNFGEAHQALGNGTAATITGVLPKTVSEDSAWADVTVDYSPQVDRLGSNLKWIRAEVSAIRTGKVQLKWSLPLIDSASEFRIESTLASNTQGRVFLRIQQTSQPYTVHWEQSILLNQNRETRISNLQLPAIDHSVALLLSLEQPGSYDLYSVKLSRRGAEELAAERAAAVAAAPANLAPATSFPLGLPTGWSVGGRVSLQTEVDFYAADAPGPEGTIPLVIDVKSEGQTYQLFSAPFEVPDPTELYIVSFIATGTGPGTLQVFCDGRPFGEGQYLASPEGTLVRVPFRVDPMSKWIVLHWNGQDDVQIDALNISMGRGLEPFTLPHPAEVALAANFKQNNVFVEGVEAPSIRYALTGDIEGAKLYYRIINLYGEEKRAQPIEIDESNRRGELPLVLPGEARNYGTFRVEAALEREGAAISRPTEVIYHVVPKPRYWGQIAPQSYFGNHFHPHEPHLYAAKAIGINWNRFHGGNAGDTTYWSAVEREKGQWRWNDARIQLYRDADFALCGVWTRVPRWARIERDDAQANGWLDNWWQPRDDAEFAEYVTRSMEHYEGTIDAWQIWNEPWGEFWFKEWREDLNGDQRWHAGETPVEDFAHLSEVAWKASQATGVKVPVLGVGATMGDKGKEWMQDMLDQGVHVLGDVISFHTYFGGDISEAISPNTNTLTQLNDRIFDPIQAHADAADMPVWMTEGNWLLRNTDSGFYNFSVPGEKDPLAIVRENCIRLPLYHATLFSQGVDKVFTYAMNGGYRYFMPQKQGQIYWGSLVTNSGGLHPAGVAYAAMAQRFEQARFLRHLQIDGDTAAFLYESGESGAQGLALFGEKSLNEYLAHFQALGLKVDDFMGNPAQSDIENQLLYIELTDGLDIDAVLNSI